MKEFHFLLSLNSITIFMLTFMHLNGRLDGVYFPPSNCMGDRYSRVILLVKFNNLTLGGKRLFSLFPWRVACFHAVPQIDSISLGKPQIELKKRKKKKRRRR